MTVPRTLFFFWFGYILFYFILIHGVVICELRGVVSIQEALHLFLIVGPVR